MNYTIHERAHDGKTTRKEECEFEIETRGKNLPLRSTVCMRKNTDKIKSDKTRSWTMTTTTMQTRHASANCERERKRTGVLLLLVREGRGRRPWGDGTIKHDSADARIDSGRELPGLHPF